MADKERDAVLEQVRTILFSMLDTGEFQYRPLGHSYVRDRIPWPGPNEHRDHAFAQIRQALYRDAGGGFIWIVPEGALPHVRFQLRWPEAGGLFAAVELPEPPPPAVRVTATATGELATEAVGERLPPKASKPCAEHVLKLLAEEQRRMTTSVLENALSARGLEWSTRAVEATCAWLVSQGKLDNARDERGKGYGLTEWKREGA